MTKVLIVAGEASADTHAAKLVRALRTRVPQLEIYGIGGRELTLEGLRVLSPSEAVNVVGLNDWLDKIPSALKALIRVCREALKTPPKLAILVDLPDFNLLLARWLRWRRVPVLYYTAPQVWAWRRYRLRTIKRCVQSVCVIFPFEEEFYRKHGVHVRYVGHPLCEKPMPAKLYRSYKERMEAPRIALLPGSRSSELNQHAPILSKLALLLRERYPGAQFILPVASTLKREKIAERMALSELTYVDSALKAYSLADIAVVATGTATLEATLAGIPNCVFYRLSRLSHFIGKSISAYQGFFGMPNLLMGKEIVREFIQAKARPELLFNECVRLLEDEDYYQQVAADLNLCRERLGTTSLEPVLEEILVTLGLEAQRQCANA